MTPPADMTAPCLPTTEMVQEWCDGWELRGGLGFAIAEVARRAYEAGRKDERELLRFEFCNFDGPAPGGYTDWHSWLASPPWRHVKVTVWTPETRADAPEERP